MHLSFTHPVTLHYAGGGEPPRTVLLSVPYSARQPRASPAVARARAYIINVALNLIASTDTLLFARRVDVFLIQIWSRF